MVRVIAVANQKGGVGKTTTTVNVAAGLAELGRTVVVMDLDPQGNATQALGLDRGTLKQSAYDVLIDELPFEDAIMPTTTPGVWCVPASVDLAGAEVEMVSQPGRESRLKKAVEAAAARGAKQLPDDGVLLLDCPPSLGLLTVNALTAADELFVPIQAEFYALDGVSQLVKTMELVRSALNPELQISLVALTMMSESTHAQDSVQDDASAFFGERLASTVIPRDPAANAAPAAGLTVLTYAPDSAAAVAYRALAAELLAAPTRQQRLDGKSTEPTDVTAETTEQPLVTSAGGTA